MSGYATRLQEFIAGIVSQWLQGPNTSTFLEALGLTLDTENATLLGGLRSMQPFLCFIDSLLDIGEERGMRRYPNEPEASFRLRLAQWRQIKAHAGSHYGEMINLQPYFLPARPMIRIFHQSADGKSSCHTYTSAGVYSVDVNAPTVWNWDDTPSLWSRFWVVIYVNGIGSDAALYDDGTTYDDGTVWDGHLSADQVADVVAIVNESKAAHSILAGVILAPDPASFDPAVPITTDGNGATSMPQGNWRYATDMTTGHPTRLDGIALAFDLYE